MDGGVVDITPESLPTTYAYRLQETISFVVLWNYSKHNATFVPKPPKPASPRLAGVIAPALFRGGRYLYTF
jgi:hypothetical protein